MVKETEEKVQEKLASLNVEALPEETIAKLEELRQKIEYVGIDEIYPSPNPGRKIDLGVPKVAASLKRLGFRSPIFVDAVNNIIVVGHTRWYAAKKLGFTKVPIVKVKDLSDEMMRVYRLADNRVAEFSTWDFAELNTEIESLKIELPDLDFGEIGFIDKPEIEWEKERDLDEKTYEEPHDNDIQCPKCGYVAGKSFFKKPTESK